MLPITIAIMARNEDWFIHYTIRSVLGLSKDILVGDMGSTDTTAKIAAGFGARVIQVPEEMMVRQGWAACRNFMNDRAKYDWVLTLDADEMLLHESAEQLKALDSWVPQCPVLITKTRTYEAKPGYGVDMARTGKFDEFPHRRLFNRTLIEWRGFVHEEPHFRAGGVAQLNVDSGIVREHFKNTRPDQTNQWKHEVDAQLFLRAIAGHISREGVNPWWFDTWVPKNIIELKALARNFFSTNPKYKDLEGMIKW